MRKTVVTSERGEKARPDHQIEGEKKGLRIWGLAKTQMKNGKGTHVDWGWAS